jgi:hypothetical protein
MFTKLKESSGKVLGFKVSGKLTDDDYKTFVPQIEKAIEQSGTIRLLWYMEDFHGWDVHAAWDDLKNWMKYNDLIDRIAMVGDKKWEEWMTKLSNPFAKAEVKYYDHFQLGEAWKWLRE